MPQVPSTARPPGIAPRAAARAAALASNTTVCLNLARVSYMSNAGLRVLVLAAQALRARDGRLRLEHVPPHIENLLRSARVHVVRGRGVTFGGPAGRPREEVGCRLLSTSGRGCPEAVLSRSFRSSPSRDIVSSNCFIVSAPAAILVIDTGASRGTNPSNQ